jgi:hypothetical protein
MSQQHRFTRWAALLPLLVIIPLVHGRPPTAAATEAIPAVAAGLHVIVDAAGPTPAADNATPLMLWAQLILDQAPQPPAAIGPVPLNLAASGVIPASAISLPTTSSCSVTNADTLLVCQITPTGATWGTADAFVVFNVLLTATSGHAQISPLEVVRIRPAAE